MAQILLEQGSTTEIEIANRGGGSSSGPGEQNVQSNYLETDTTDDAFIIGKPTVNNFVDSSQDVFNFADDSMLARFVTDSTTYRSFVIEQVGLTRFLIGAIPASVTGVDNAIFNPYGAALGALNGRYRISAVINGIELEDLQLRQVRIAGTADTQALSLPGGGVFIADITEAQYDALSVTSNNSQTQPDGDSVSYFTDNEMQLFISSVIPRRSNANMIAGPGPITISTGVDTTNEFTDFGTVGHVDSGTTYQLAIQRFTFEGRIVTDLDFTVRGANGAEVEANTPWSNGDFITVLLTDSNIVIPMNSVSDSASSRTFLGSTFGSDGHISHLSDDIMNSIVAAADLTVPFTGGNIYYFENFRVFNQANSPLNSNFTIDIDESGLGGASALNDLTDAVITTPTNNQVLAYNGTDWVNAPAPVSSGGIVSSITTGVVNEARIIDFVASGVTTRIREGRADIIELSTSGGTVSGHQFAKLADEQVVLSSTDGDTTLTDNTGYDDGDPVGINSTSLVQINAGTYDPITNPRGNLKEENISETSFVHHGALIETPFYDGEVRITRDGSNVVSIEFGDEFNARDFLNRINLTRNNSTTQVVAGQTVTGDANSHLQIGRFYSQSGSGEVFTVYNAVDGFPGLRFQGANNDGIPSGVTSIRVTNSATLGDIVEGAVLLTTDDGFLTVETSATDNSLDIGIGNQMLHMMIKTIGDTPTRLGTPISSGGVTVQYSLNSTTYYIDWNADRSSERLIASDRTTVLNIRTLTSNNI